MMRYVDFIISRLREKNCYDMTQYEFYCTTEINPPASGEHWASWTCLVAPQLVGNCGFWVHEFTEMSIIQILNRWQMPWRNRIEFAGFKRATVCHLIAPFGVNNGRSLFPQVSKRIPKW